MTWEEMTTQGQWNVLGPLRAGRGPPDLKTCKHILAEVKKQHPDLVILEPPVGPWSTWEKSSKDDVRRMKEKYLPLWWLVHKLWELQTDKGRLVLLRCPAKVSLPGPEELRDLLAAWKHHMPADVQTNFHGFEQREPLFETKIHMCTQGLRDPDSGKWLKRSSRV